MSAPPVDAAPPVELVPVMLQDIAPLLVEAAVSFAVVVGLLATRMRLLGAAARAGSLDDGALHETVDLHTVEQIAEALSLTVGSSVRLEKKLASYASSAEAAHGHKRVQEARDAGCAAAKDRCDCEACVAGKAVAQAAALKACQS